MKDMTRGDKYRGELKVGQKIHSILNGGRDGVICGINGVQNPETIRTLGRGCLVIGGRATVDIVFEEYVSPMISEAIIRGVQWFISDEIVDPGEIKAMVAHADTVKIEKAEAEKKSAEGKAVYSVGLPSKYPFLIPVNGSGKSAHVLGAKNLKTELERVFKGVKFSTRSKTYSGGDSIDFSWTDGPTQEEARKISDKYQEGNFNGMDDSYAYNHSAWPEVFGGAKYVFGTRHESAALVTKSAQNLGFELFPDQFDRWDNIVDGVLLDEQRQMIYRDARAISMGAPNADP